MTAGWWWMMAGDNEEAVKIYRANGSTDQDGVNGLMVYPTSWTDTDKSLKDEVFSHMLWSRYPIYSPSEVDRARIKVTIDQHNIEVQIMDGEMLCSMAPERTLDGYFTTAMINIFEEIERPIRKQSLETIHEYREFMAFISLRNPALLTEFKATHQRP